MQNPLPIMFDKVDGVIRDYGGTKYLVLIGPENYDDIFIGYLLIIVQKSRLIQMMICP